MKVLLLFFLFCSFTLRSQKAPVFLPGDSGFVTLIAFKTFIESKLALFNDLLSMEADNNRFRKHYLHVREEYGKLNVEYNKFREQLINCVRANDNKKSALACISNNALNIDSVSKRFLEKIQEALDQHLKEPTPAGEEKEKNSNLVTAAKNIDNAYFDKTANSSFNMPGAITATEIINFIFAIAGKTNERRQKQLEVLSAEIRSDRYQLRSFGAIVRWKKHPAND